MKQIKCSGSKIITFHIKNFYS